MEINELYAHWFKEHTVAGDISDFAYKSLNIEGWEMKEYSIGNQDYRDQGLFGQWDQE